LRPSVRPEVALHLAIRPFWKLSSKHHIGGHFASRAIRGLVLGASYGSPRSKEMRATVGGILILVTCSVATADSLIVGAGTSSCGDFIKHYKQHPDATDLVYLSWVQGFISGKNDLLIRTGKPRNLPDKDEIVSAIHSYCDAHPLGNLLKMASQYYNSLPEFSQRSN
jgi:hypothetical protein